MSRAVTAAPLLEVVMLVRIASCVLCFLFCSANAFAQNLLWELVEDLSGGSDYVRAITLSKRAAVVMGNADNFDTDVHDFVIQALRRSDGAVRWTDRVPETPGRGQIGLQIASFQGRVFVSGYVAGDFPGSTDLVVRGYDSFQGTLLWSSVWDTGRDDQPRAIVAGPTAVVVVGYGGNTPGHAINFMVRAYEPTSGAVLWEDRIERADLESIAWEVAVTRNRVFVAGTTLNTASERDLLLRTYSTASGELIWETTRPFTSPNAIEVAGGRVFLAGSSSNHAYVGVLEAKSGAWLWEDESTGGRFFDMAVQGNRVVAVGSSSEIELLVRAYDVRDGTMEWQDHPSRVGGFSEVALGVALNDRAVYVVGGSGEDFVYSEMMIRGYAAQDGTLLWDDRPHRSGALGTPAVDVVLGKNRLFVVGTAQSDFVIRAYGIQGDAR